MTDKEKRIVKLINEYDFSVKQIPKEVHKIFQGEHLLVYSKLQKSYNLLLQSSRIINQLIKLSNSDLHTTSEGCLEISKIIRLVCQKLNITEEELKSKSRRKPLPEAKAICACLILSNSKLSLSEISKYISENGFLDHTSVLYYKNKYFMFLRENGIFAKIISEIEEELNLSNYNIGRLNIKKSKI